MTSRWVEIKKSIVTPWKLKSCSRCLKAIRTSPSPRPSTRCGQRHVVLQLNAWAVAKGDRLELS